MKEDEDSKELDDALIMACVCTAIERQLKEVSDNISKYAKTYKDLFEKYRFSVFIGVHHTDEVSGMSMHGSRIGLKEILKEFDKKLNDKEEV